MPISFDNIAIFSAGGALGYFVRTFIDHRLAKSRTDEDRRIKGFNESAIKFRSTIINELVGLYPIPIDWPRDIARRFNATFPKIQAAVEEFKPFVPSGQVKAFNKAWLQYYTHCKHVVPKAFSPEGKIYGEKTSQEVRDEFKHNVDALLSFAKEK